MVKTIMAIPIAPLETGLAGQFTWSPEVVSDVAGVVGCGQVCGGCVAQLSIGEGWRRAAVTD